MNKVELKKQWIELIGLMEKLRSPDGCPWDKEQTYKSLQPCIIEEAYEVIEAIEKEDKLLLKEELGDLLLQVVFQAQIAREKGDFNLVDVVKELNEKLIRRHPHVFEDEDLETVNEVLSNWNKIKKAEKNENDDKMIMDDISESQPALNMAEEVQKKGAKIGFDWTNVKGVINKIEEEFLEVKEALQMNERSKIEEEIGDLLFSVVNLSRFSDVNSELALFKTIVKFKERFKFMEQLAKYEEVSLNELSLEELESFWEKAKRDCNKEA